MHLFYQFYVYFFVCSLSLLHLFVPLHWVFFLFHFEILMWMHECNITYVFQNETFANIIDNSSAIACIRPTLCEYIHKTGIISMNGFTSMLIRMWLPRIFLPLIYFYFFPLHSIAECLRMRRANVCLKVCDLFDDDDDDLPLGKNVKSCWLMNKRQRALAFLWIVLLLWIKGRYFSFVADLTATDESTRTTIKNTKIESKMDVNMQKVCSTIDLSYMIWYVNKKRTFCFS